VPNKLAAVPRLPRATELSNATQRVSEQDSLGRCTTLYSACQAPPIRFTPLGVVSIRARSSGRTKRLPSFIVRGGTLCGTRMELDVTTAKVDAEGAKLGSIER